MPLLDEEIVKGRSIQRNLAHLNIKEGVYIKERIAVFKEQFFFDDKMSIWIPSHFVPMPPEIAKIKYPSEQRPKLILTSPDLTVNLCLSYLDQEIATDEVWQAVSGYQLIIRKLQPSNVFFEKKVVSLNNSSYGWFDYKSYALDEQLYNLMFVTCVANKLLLGTFNCIFKDVGEWKPYVLQMIQSIRDLAEKGR